MAVASSDCQCKTGAACFAWGEETAHGPCEGSITQEDLLCDPCREANGRFHCHGCGRISDARPRSVVDRVRARLDKIRAQAPRDTYPDDPWRNK